MTIVRLLILQHAGPPVRTSAPVSLSLSLLRRRFLWGTNVRSFRILIKRSWEKLLRAHSTRIRRRDAAGRWHLDDVRTANAGLTYSCGLFFFARRLIDIDRGFVFFPCRHCGRLLMWCAIRQLHSGTVACSIKQRGWWADHLQKSSEFFIDHICFCIWLNVDAEYADIHERFSSEMRQKWHSRLESGTVFLGQCTRFATNGWSELCSNAKTIFMGYFIQVLIENWTIGKNNACSKE